MSLDYDAIWRRSWSEITDASPVHRHLTKMLIDMARPLRVHSVLDVGCGNGANLKALQDQLGATDAWGIDVSEEALIEARTRVRGTFRQMSLMTQPLDRTFDLVLTSQVIEHIEDDKAFLSALRRVCERYCIVTTLQGRMRSSERYIGHVRNYRPGELQEKMRAAGLAPERVIEWGFPFYSPIMRTLVEYLRSDPSKTSDTPMFRAAAKVLYQLYRLNTARRGDVLIVLARTA